MILALKIAIRFLKTSKLQTLTIMLGIAVGVSVQIFIGSLIGGLQKDLINTTIGSSSQVTISSAQSGGAIDGKLQLANELYDIDSNISIVSLSVDGAGAIVKGTSTDPILLRGFEFARANQIYGFDKKLIDGDLPLLNGYAAIGKQLAALYEAQVGDTITIQIPLVGQADLEVSGIYDFDVASINKSWIIANLATAQTALGLQFSEITSVEMQVSDVFAADTTAALVQEFLSDEALTVSNWKELNASLLSGLQGQSTSSLMIQVFVMISVVLGIASVLAITVMQKSKQIGILKAMGLTNRDASLVFLFEGFVLGLFGAGLGVLFGLGLAYMFSTFALDQAGNPIIALFIDQQFIIVSAVIATLASTMAALIPARKSSKLSIIEVIRNG